MKPWKFFPVVGKQPALQGDWRGHSTSDPAQLQRWRDDGYGLALDCEASGVLVVDVDPGGITPDFATMRKHTPRGGVHMIFEGEGPTTVQKLSEHVDTRGVGGYIVYEGPGYGPPVGEVAKLPPEISEKISASREGTAAKVEDLDQAHNVKRAIDWLQRREPLVQGHGADSGTLFAANTLMDLGLSAEKSIEILRDHLKIEPRDDRFEAFIVRKVENAEAYRQNEAGAWAVDPPLSRFGDTLTRLGLNQERGVDTPKTPKFYAYSVDEQDELSTPQMVVPDFLPNEALTMLYGAPGSYKSFIALDFALTLAAGIEGWGWKGEETPVLYVAGEGPRSVAKQRRPAWEAEHRVDWTYPFHLVTSMPTVAGDTVTAFIDQIKAQRLRPKVIVIDTMARFMLGLNENDVKDAQLAVNALEQLRDVFHCAVLVVHHTGKAGEGPRGSSALPGGFDTLHEVVANKAAKVVAVTNKLQKDGEERREAWCFEGHKASSSLVFKPITPGQFKEMSTQDDGLNEKRIRGVLQELEAFASPGITTRALATALYQGPKDEDPTSIQLKLRDLDGRLQTAARGRLTHVSERIGRELRWWLKS